MREERWISTLKMVLIILVVIAIALLVTHTDEIGRWFTENMMSGTRSDLQELLQ